MERQWPRQETRPLRSLNLPSAWANSRSRGFGCSACNTVRGMWLEIAVPGGRSSVRRWTVTTLLGSSAIFVISQAERRITVRR